MLHETIERREGTTPYTRLGMGPAVVVALASLALGWFVARRTSRAAGNGADPSSRPRVRPRRRG